ncbi:MAG: hypothetical protein AAF328_07900 [Planctomycetota bacterium]
MQRLRTVLLRHARRGDTHFDWMFETPGRGAPIAPLTTFRLALPWEHWTQVGQIALTPLPPHRRAYLSRQGPVSGGRGFVTRVATGTLDVADWHTAGARLVLQSDANATAIDITLKHATGKNASFYAAAFGSAAAKR